MKLLLSVATVILLSVLGTIQFQETKPDANSHMAEPDPAQVASEAALSGLLAIQAELIDLVEDLDWVIYANDIHYHFRLRMDEDVRALKRELEQKMNSLGGVVTNFVPVDQKVDGLASLLRDFAEQDELGYYADKAYGRATAMRDAVESIIEELQAISDDLAQTPGAQEGEKHE